MKTNIINIVEEEDPMILTRIAKEVQRARREYADRLGRIKIGLC